MKPSLTQVRGIGLSTADVLTEHGIRSVAELAAASAEQLGRIPGFGPTRAAETIRAARELLSPGTRPPAAGSTRASAAPKAPSGRQAGKGKRRSERGDKHKDKHKDKDKKSRKKKKKKDKDKKKARKNRK